MDRITLFCFGASYAVALLLELLQLAWPRRIQRYTATGFAAAGILAHTIYLAVQRPSLSTRFGSLLFLAWILAVFYCYGSIHHKKLAWGVFVLPLVIGLVVLAAFFAPLAMREAMIASSNDAYSPDWERYWGMLHGALLLLAAVGGCVGFLASVMYLLQAHRLRVKAAPGHGLKLLSLERLEQMNRRAINGAFPLMTGGVLIGAFLMWQSRERLNGWLDPRVLGAILLWLVFGLLVYLRYGVHLQGRRLAVWTIVAFALLLLTLAAPTHQFNSAGVP